MGRRSPIQPAMLGGDRRIGLDNTGVDATASGERERLEHLPGSLERSQRGQHARGDQGAEEPLAADPSVTHLVTEHRQQSLQGVKLLRCFGPYRQLIRREQSQLARRLAEEHHEVFAETRLRPPVAGLPPPDRVARQPGIALAGVAHAALDLLAQLLVAPATFEPIPGQLSVRRISPCRAHRASPPPSHVR